MVQNNKKIRLNLNIAVANIYLGLFKAQLTTDWNFFLSPWQQTVISSSLLPSTLEANCSTSSLKKMKRLLHHKFVKHTVWVTYSKRNSINYHNEMHKTFHLVTCRAKGKLVTWHFATVVAVKIPFCFCYKLQEYRCKTNFILSTKFCNENCIFASIGSHLPGELHDTKAVTFTSRTLHLRYIISATIAANHLTMTHNDTKRNTWHTEIVKE